jgi:hypothetical protein
VATKAAVERCARERQRGDIDIAQRRAFGTQALELGGSKAQKSLDRLLTAPMRAVPGTRMTYDGVPDRQQRADLIAFLQAAERSLACRHGDTVTQLVFFDTLAAPRILD